MCFLGTKIMTLQRSRNEIILFFSKNPVFRASYWILLCNCGLQRSSSCVKLMEVRLAFLFNIIHFVDTQFCKNLSLFLWNQNYGFSRDREMKSFYFSPKWRSSGLPIEFFCVTEGFQRSSYCVKPVEVRLAFFLYNTFSRYSVSRKS